MKVQILLNISRDSFFGFDNTFSPAVLRNVLTYEVAVTASTSVGSILEQAFEQLNVGGEPGYPATEWCKFYRLNGNRSLSKGDVVIVGETAFSCESAGWKRQTTDAILAALNAEVSA